MQRLSFVLSSAVLLLSTSTLMAQHSGGGGHPGGGSFGGGHSGFAGGHSGVSAPAYRSGSSSGTTISTLSPRNPGPSQLIYPTPIGLQQQFSGYTGINRGALNTTPGYGGFGNGAYRNGGYRNEYGGGPWRNRDNRGYGYGYGYYPWFPLYYSTFDDSDGSYTGYNYGDEGYAPPDNYYPQTGIDPNTQPGDETANALGQQIAQLSAQVQALSNQRINMQSAPVPYRDPSTDSDSTPATPPITLVLHSGKQIKLQNYAVMGQYIWDFSTQPAKKIALSTVDLSASKAATEANGADFPDTSS